VNVNRGDLKGFPTRLMGLLGIAIFTPTAMNAVSSSGPVSALGAVVGVGALMGAVFLFWQAGTVATRYLVLFLLTLGLAFAAAALM
jgi:hypothetical protein